MEKAQTNERSKEIYNGIPNFRANLISSSNRQLQEQGHKLD